MDRTEEKNLLLCELFDVKARLPFARNDEKKQEELLKKISEIREKLVELETEEMMEQEQKERTFGNG